MKVFRSCRQCKHGGTSDNDGIFSSMYDARRPVFAMKVSYLYKCSRSYFMRGRYKTILEWNWK